MRLRVKGLFQDKNTNQWLSLQCVGPVVNIDQIADPASSSRFLVVGIDINRKQWEEEVFSARSNLGNVEI